jgi:exosortase A-associated hydrolase 2
VSATSAGVVRNPFFLARPTGDLFAVHFAPRPPLRGAGGAVFLPPFAEEMNRSRRMMALQASALAAAGVEALIVDLHGCGDSAGRSGEATWPLWLDGAIAAVDWLSRRTGGRVAVGGLRLGAVLAVEAARREPRRISRLVLWQPVVSGKTMLTQFLRIRLAAGLATGGGETTESLRTLLASGTAVEIAGYELSPPLARAIDAVRLDELAPPAEVPTDWFEVLAHAEQPVPPVATRTVEGWRSRGARVELRTVVGDAFWTTQETTTAPELIAATAHLFERVPA